MSMPHPHENLVYLLAARHEHLYDIVVEEVRYIREKNYLLVRYRAEPRGANVLILRTTVWDAVIELGEDEKPFTVLSTSQLN